MKALVYLICAVVAVSVMGCAAQQAALKSPPAKNYKSASK